MSRLVFCENIKKKSECLLLQIVLVTLRVIFHPFHSLLIFTYNMLMDNDKVKN